MCDKLPVMRVKLKGGNTSAPMLSGSPIESKSCVSGGPCGPCGPCGPDGLGGSKTK